MEGNVAAVFIDKSNKAYMYTFYDPRIKTSAYNTNFPHKNITVDSGYFMIKVPAEVINSAQSAGVVRIPLGIELGGNVDEDLKQRILSEGKEIFELDMASIYLYLYPLL